MRGSPSSTASLNPATFHISGNSENDDTLALLEDADRKAFETPKHKPLGACVDCKSVKVRCTPVPGQRKCERCQLKNLPCRPRDRKKRKAAETHEELLEKAHQQDLKIQELLRQYDEQKAADKIAHWINKSHPKVPHEWQARSDPFSVRDKWLKRGKSMEEAAVLYFRNGRPGTGAACLPEIVKHCILYPEEIESLFSIFFQQINPYFSILDENIHIPEKLIWTAPFLFTVICAISSRHLTSRPDLYALAMDFARDAASRALVDGNRSIDMCQAYLLMALYPVPKKRWGEDRSWLLMGVAIKMAIELGLDQPPQPGCSEQEKLNRVRTWLNCYCVDKSHAIQFGKMPMIRWDNYLARSSTSWYKSSSFNNPFDVHLCGYVRILSIMVDWQEAIGDPSSDSGLPGYPGTIKRAISTQHALQCEIDKWREAYSYEFQRHSLPICSYRGHTTHLITAYLQLVVLSSAFRAALKIDDSEDSVNVLRLAIDSAYTVIRITVNHLAPTGYLRYAMDANFLYVSFAASFLINLLRPKFTSLLNNQERETIVATVTRLIEVLSSPQVALDGRHTPALYARFLSSLLGKYHVRPQDSGMHSSDFSLSKVNDSSRLQLDPMRGYSWLTQTSTGPSSVIPTGYSEHMMDAMHPGDADQYFNLDHFVKNVAVSLPVQVADQTYLGTGAQVQSPDFSFNLAFSKGSSSASGAWNGHL